MKADRLRVSIPLIKVYQLYKLRKLYKLCIKKGQLSQDICTVKIFQRLQRIWKNTECIS